MSISVVNVVPALLVLILAFGSAFLLSKVTTQAADKGRFVSIDGLRGYLAVFVFIHHGCIWYFYLRTGEWHPPPSNPYTIFGEAAVGFFFMITGFLFFSKIIKVRNQGLDWFGFYVSRLMRLAPLYFAVLICLFAVVAIVTHGELRDTPWHLVRGICRWVIFTILGSPDLNNLGHTAAIVAGVTWSLSYEWFFYLTLPVIAGCAGMKIPLRYLAIGLMASVSLYFWGPKTWHLFAFLSGMLSALLYKAKFVQAHGPKWYSSIFIILSLTLICYFSDTAYTEVPLLVMAICFLMLASGNTIFGTLSNSTSIFLGEMAYSIYLLHGLVLFSIFNFVYAPSLSKQFEPTKHWLLIAAATPLLILISYLSCTLIEKPGIKRSASLTEWARNRLK